MIAKRAQFFIVGRRGEQPSAATANACNDNYKVHGLRARSRPILACRWHETPSGGPLECIWQFAAVNPSSDPSTAEEPGISLPMAWAGAAHHLQAA